MDTPELSALVRKNVFKYHGVPQTIISDRGVTFTSKFWKEFLNCLGSSSVLSTAYHPQTDGQTERTNGILKTYLRLFCNYNQDNWSQILDLAEFSYNNTWQSAANCSPFFANYGFNPPFDVSPSNITISNCPSAKERVKYIHDIQTELISHLEKASYDMKRFADTSRQDITPFAIGDLVYLSLRNVKTSRPSESLDYRRVGPFPVSKLVGSHAYQLKLPDSMKIHDVFHVSLLTRFTTNTIEGRIPPTPLPVIIDSNEEYIVESIKSVKVHRGKLQFLVCWKGYDADTWEPESAVSDTIALTNFEQDYPHLMEKAFKKQNSTKVKSKSGRLE
jgi:hypothetical protein